MEPSTIHLWTEWDLLSLEFCSSSYILVSYNSSNVWRRGLPFRVHRGADLGVQGLTEGPGVGQMRMEAD